MASHHSVLKVNEEQLTIEKDCERRVTLCHDGVIISNPATFTTSFTTAGALFDGTVSCQFDYWKCGLPNQYSVRTSGFTVQVKEETGQDSALLSTTSLPSELCPAGNDFVSPVIIFNSGAKAYGYIIFRTNGSIRLETDDADGNFNHTGTGTIRLYPQTFVVETGKWTV